MEPAEQFVSIEWLDPPEAIVTTTRGRYYKVPHLIFQDMETGEYIHGRKNAWLEDFWDTERVQTFWLLGYEKAIPTKWTKVST